MWTVLLNLQNLGAFSSLILILAKIIQSRM
jgi:hypothetical protein